MEKLEVLYEDNHIIVVVKPPNVLSQKDVTNDLDILTMVKNYVKVKYKKPGNVYIGLVHRLDRPVGGIMVLARTSKAAARLSKMFKENKVTKKYLALVHGNIVNDGKMTDYLLKLDNGNTVVDSKGKLSELEYKVLENKNDKTLLEITLITGRHHQIRVQFASRGFPLVGETRYFNSPETELSLFAYYLEFIHPVTKELMKFTYRKEWQ